MLGLNVAMLGLNVAMLAKITLNTSREHRDAGIQRRDIGTFTLWNVATLDPNIVTLARMSRPCPVFMKMKVHIFRSHTFETLTLSLVFAGSIANPPSTASQTVFASLKDLRTSLDAKILEFSLCSHLLTISGFRVSQGES